MNAAQSPKATKGSHKTIDTGNFTNYLTNVIRLKPSLDRLNYSNMMIMQNFLHQKEISPPPNDDDTQVEVQN